MNTEMALIATVAMGFGCALVGGFIAARLRLPPLVGYLAAGIAIGPFTPGFVGDPNIAHQLSEIGVVLLMFGVGMHFSLGDLSAVRNVAVPGALIEICIITSLGFGLSRWWGWSLQAGLILGLSLSIASTVVLLRGLESRNALHSMAGRISVGWLVVEDLVAVLLLVVLPTLNGPGEDLWHMLGITLLKVAAFIAFMVVVGSRVLPWLLNQVVRTGSRELFTLAVVAIALGIGFGASALLGLSPALGAFAAGVVINGTAFNDRAAADTLPLQDVFAVLFFVSVGMLFDPAILLRQPRQVAAVLAVIVVGKPLVAYLVTRLLRQSTDTARGIAAGLAQIGEFSFILVALGVKLDLLPEDGQALVLAGALLAITLNPFIIRAMAPR